MAEQLFKHFFPTVTQTTVCGQTATHQQQQIEDLSLANSGLKYVIQTTQNDLMSAELRCASLNTDLQHSSHVCDELNKNWHGAVAYYHQVEQELKDVKAAHQRQIIAYQQRIKSDHKQFDMMIKKAEQANQELCKERAALRKALHRANSERSLCKAPVVSSKKVKHSKANILKLCPTDELKIILSADPTGVSTLILTHNGIIAANAYMFVWNAVCSNVSLDSDTKFRAIQSMKKNEDFVDSAGRNWAAEFAEYFKVLI